VEGGVRRREGAPNVRSLSYAVRVTLVATDRPQGRCDLHVHSRYTTDSGNYALRRARLGESFTESERIYDVASAGA
jgi:hypothetical protein